MSAVRKEVIGDATLYLGDAICLASSIQSHAIITDPVWPNCPPGLLPGSADPRGLFDAFWTVAPEVKRAVVVMRHDSDPRFLSSVPMAYSRAVSLRYVIPGYIGRFLGGDEIAYCFGEPIASAPGQRVIPGRAPPAQPSGRPPNGHPCSRALTHFLFLVRWWSEPWEVVFDPFMGSGTTGVAAIKLGRRFIGIEIEPAYFDIACRRIEEASRQADLFINRPSAPKQEALL